MVRSLADRSFQLSDRPEEPSECAPVQPEELARRRRRHGRGARLVLEEGQLAEEHPLGVAHHDLLLAADNLLRLGRAAHQDVEFITSLTCGETTAR